VACKRCGQIVGGQSINGRKICAASFEGWQFYADFNPLDDGTDPIVAANNALSLKEIEEELGGNGARTINHQRVEKAINGGTWQWHDCQ
jgi:hypothetical protein